MGRNSLGPSNISLQNTLYSSCFRLQQNDMSWLGSAGTPTKSFSLCKFINFEGAAPWLIEGRTGPTEASGTDYSINTYFKQTGGTSGYLYYLKLFNGSNCSITLSNPGTGPGYALNPFYASTSASDGVIGYPYIWNSAQQSYFNLTAAATTGNTFDGWYIDEQYLFPYNPSNPLISDTTLYAREIDNTVFDNVSSNQIDITFWHIYGQSKSALLDEMIADFKLLYPNININSMSQGTYSDLKENVLSAFENNMLPNIVLGYDLDMQLYYQLGILNELSPFMNHTLFPLNINSFIDGYISYNDNKLTSLPFSKSSEVLLYNKSLLSAHGIVFEENQVLTYAELQAIATTVVGTGENQCSALIGYDSISSYLSKEIYSSSIDFTNGIGESELVPVLTKLSTDYSSKIFTTPKVNDEYYGSTAFLNKEICMISAHSAGLRYNIPTYLSVEDTFEIGILPLPQMDNQTN